MLESEVMNKKPVLAILFGLVALAALGVTAFQIWEKQNAFRGSEIVPAQAAAPIVLQRLDGSTYDLTARRGRVAVLYFGYTHCPDYCPGTLAKFQQIVTRMGEDARQVDFVFITADPDRDSPEVADEYARHFNPAFIGLSGTEEELAPIWQAYFVGRLIVPMPESVLGYTVQHSTRAYVIDKQGNLRLTFPFELQAADMAHDLQLLLAE